MTWFTTFSSPSTVQMFFIFLFFLAFRQLSFSSLPVNPPQTFYTIWCLIRTNADCHVLLFIFQHKYRAKGVEAFKDYSVVLETPEYETAKQNAQNLSDVSDSLNSLNGVGLLLSIFHYVTKNHDNTSNLFFFSFSSCTIAMITTPMSREPTLLLLSLLIQRGHAWQTTSRVM